MAIEVYKRPFEWSWSGNPVHYQLYSAQAAADPDIFFEIRIQYKSITALQFTELVTLPFNPTEGFVEIDLKGALNSKLSWNVPPIDDTVIAPTIGFNQTGSYYIEFREITTQNTNPAWNATEKEFPRYIIKGGIDKFRWQGNNFWLNYFEVKKPFLTWQRSGRLASYNERMYLAWLCSEADGGMITIKATAVCTDGTSGVKNSGFYPVKGLVYYIPAGAFQWDLSSIQPAKDLWYWEIQLFNGNTPVSEAFRYESDNRNTYSDITLHCRGSLGGIDSVEIRGVVDQKLQYEFQEAEMVVAPNYFEGHYITPSKTVHSNIEKKIWSGNIGHLSIDDQDRLRDAQLIRDTWWERAKKWWPVTIITKDFLLRKSDDQLFSMPIEFTLAGEGSEHYTPDAADLGEGVFTSNVCRAYLSPLNVEVDLTNGGLNNGLALITVTFTEIDPQNASDNLRWRVVDGAGGEVIAWTLQSMAAGFSFTVAKDLSFILEAVAVCTNDILGKKTTTPFSTTAGGGGNGGGGGTGGGGGGGTANDNELVNDTSEIVEFELYINGSLVAAGHVGSFNSFYFPSADDPAAEVILKILPEGMAQLASMYKLTVKGTGNVYMPLIDLGSTTMVFPSVDIQGGFILRMQ